MRTARFWVAPITGLALAVILAAASLTIDSRLTWPAAPPPPLFAGSASTAGTLLAAIAGAITSLLALVFTIITVIIQLATGQYSARALRTLYMDRPSHFTIGTFVATISYALLVLPSVSSEADPLGVSVLLAVVLAVFSVVTFAIFAHHIAHLIRVGSLADTVATDTRAAIDRVMPHPVTRQADGSPTISPPEAAQSQVIVTTTSGSLVYVNELALLRAAHKMNGMIEVVPAIGDYLPEGAPLFRVWSSATSHPMLSRSVTIDVERRLDHDVGWGLRLLVDMCLRALSPAINDPTTAVQSLDRIHDLLRVLATRAMPDVARCDSAGTLRLQMMSPSWDDFVALGTDEIRLAGASQLQVLRRLRALLLDVRAVAPPERQSPLERRLELLNVAVEHHLESVDDPRNALQPDSQGIGGAGRAG